MKYKIHDVYVRSSTLPEALAEFERVVKSGRRAFVVFLEANLLYSLLTVKGLAKILSKAEYIFPDGTAIVKAILMRHQKNISRISGPTFMLRACEHGQPLKWWHFFYGGAPEVADKLVAKLKADYPDMIVAGVYSPPFRKIKDNALDIPPEEDAAEIKMINDARPDFVWVGLGGPKQEYWMYSHLDRIDAPLMLGVGAAFDFHSGNRPWAPKIVRLVGMEWLYRMCSGGKATFKRNLRCVSGSLVLLIEYFIKYVLMRWHP